MNSQEINKACLNCSLPDCEDSCEHHGHEGRRAANRRYYEKNKKELQKQSLDRYYRNREKRLEYAKRYYASNRESILKKIKERKEDNA